MKQDPLSRRACYVVAFSCVDCVRNELGEVSTIDEGAIRRKDIGKTLAGVCGQEGHSSQNNQMSLHLGPDRNIPWPREANEVPLTTSLTAPFTSEIGKSTSHRFSFFVAI